MFVTVGQLSERNELQHPQICLGSAEPGTVWLNARFGALVVIRLCQGSSSISLFAW
jgi:hypothetical protein